MSTEEVAKHLNDLAKLIAENIPDIAQLAATESLSVVRDRIIETGEFGENSTSFEYDTTSIYVNPKNSPKSFTPKGKGVEKTRKKKGGVKEVYRSNTGSTFKNGNERQTRYFEQGYKGFRDFIGRETEFVNLSLSGSMLRSLAIIKAEDGDKGYTVTIGTKNKNEGEKLEGQQDRYRQAGDILGMTEEEQAKIQKLIDKQFDKLIKQAGL